MLLCCCSLQGVASPRASCGAWSSYCAARSCWRWHLDDFNLIAVCWSIWCFKASICTMFAALLSNHLDLSLPYSRSFLRRTSEIYILWGPERIGHEKGVAEARAFRYRARRRSHHIYAAAAKLWSHGVEWEKALAIINEAFDAATFEEWRIMSCQRISNLHKEKEKNLHGQHKMHCKRLLLFHVDIDPGCDSKSYGLVGVPKYFFWGSNGRWFETLAVWFWVERHPPPNAKVKFEKNRILASEMCFNSLISWQHYSYTIIILSILLIASLPVMPGLCWREPGFNAKPC